MPWDTGTGLPSPYTAAIEEIASYFDRKPGVDALLLTGSWARNKGNLALETDCDLILLHNELFDLEGEMGAYEKWEHKRNEIWQLDHLGPYSFIDLHPHDGNFSPGYHGFTGGPDDFELEIGNTLVYVHPIFTWTDRLQQLQAQWLPSYILYLIQSLTVSKQALTRSAYGGPHRELLEQGGMCMYRKVCGSLLFFVVVDSYLRA